MGWLDGCQKCAKTGCRLKGGRLNRRKEGEENLLLVVVVGGGGWMGGWVVAGLCVSDDSK